MANLQTVNLHTYLLSYQLVMANLQTVNFHGLRDVNIIIAMYIHEFPQGRCLQHCCKFWNIVERLIKGTLPKS